MLKIGLTGNIGSGKTYIAKVFQLLNIPVFCADDEAKLILEYPEIKKKLIQILGENSCQNGRINKKYIADKIFNNQELMREMNNLIHPLTVQNFELWLLKQSSPYIIKESAIMFESIARQTVDFVIGVHCPNSEIIDRLLAKGNLSKDEILTRQQQQLSSSIKMKLCDFVIDNSNQTLILPQVIHIHLKILEKIK